MAPTKTLTPAPWRLKLASRNRSCWTMWGTQAWSSRKYTSYQTRKFQARRVLQMSFSSTCLGKLVKQYASSSFSCGWLGTHRQADRHKESCTVLLHKKGSVFSNWTPIALDNTLYKLWTGMVTQCLAQHAEHFDIMSSTQEGFKAQKSNH